MSLNTLTIPFRGIDFEVEFEYTPAEPMTHDYPGNGEEIEITSITHKGSDFSEFFMEYYEGRRVLLMLRQRIIDARNEMKEEN